MTGPADPTRRKGRPGASSDDALRRMKAQRLRDTAAEVALRSELHRLGLRFRVEQKVLPGLRRRADVVFPRAKVAVLIDGCFWHACPVHATWPKANADWWKNKIEANRKRDADTNEALARAGWYVVRVWEHEPAPSAAGRVAAIVRSRRAGELPGGGVQLGV
jgi:DNA mismatch endonuclease (patch repair protein)